MKVAHKWDITIVTYLILEQILGINIMISTFLINLLNKFSSKLKALMLQVHII